MFGSREVWCCFLNSHFAGKIILRLRSPVTESTGSISKNVKLFSLSSLAISQCSLVSIQVSVMVGFFFIEHYFHGKTETGIVELMLRLDKKLT